jgi:hypothetical protein
MDVLKRNGRFENKIFEMDRMFENKIFCFDKTKCLKTKYFVLMSGF